MPRRSRPRSGLLRSEEEGASQLGNLQRFGQLRGDESAWLKQHERDLARRAFPVFAPMWVVLRGPRPEAVSLGVASLPRAHLQSSPGDLDFCLRVRAQVVHPGGIPRVAALRGYDQEVLPVGHVHERRRAQLAALGTDVIQQQQRGQARQAATDSPAGRAVDRRMPSINAPSRGQRWSARSR
jgi:hypothetical protein